MFSGAVDSGRVPIGRENAKVVEKKEGPSIQGIRLNGGALINVWGMIFPILLMFIPLVSGEPSSTEASATAMVGRLRSLLTGTTYRSFTVVERACLEGRNAQDPFQ